MIQSRRNLLTAFGAAWGFAAAGQLIPSFAEQHPVSPHYSQRPVSHGPQDENDGPQPNPAQRQGDLNRQLQAAIRTEVDKLCQMANELKEDMLRVNPTETLSVTFVKKAQAIEKLAKQIKDQAKG